MKKLFITILIFLISMSFVQGQNVPPGIAYQAVAIKDGPHALGGQNASSFNWSNKDIQVRFTIFEKYPGGSNQYTEVHKTKTDEYGVFNLIIGQGQSISGVFENIQWDLGTAHLQVEIDFQNNNTFKLTSLERFWSVPYAFNTRNSKGGGMNNDSALNSLNNKFNYLKNRDKDTVVGNEEGVSYKSLDSLNQILTSQLAMLKSTIKDTLVGNEWQNLSLKKDSVLISNGTGIKLMDNDSLNELQKLSLKGDTIFISKGNSIKLPSNPVSQIIKSYYRSGVSLNATLKSTSSPYGWIWEASSKIDTFTLTKGDRIVIYSTSFGLISGLVGSLSILDKNGTTQNAFMISHESTTSGSSPQGLSYAALTNTASASTPSRIYEIHFTAPQNGTYYFSCISQTFTSPGATSAYLNAGPWYVEIN